ncbi:MAG: dihydrofolate reductase family protein [Acidimicrobiia bacterium]
MLRSVDPSNDPLNPLDLVLTEERIASGRPWVMLNMISSLDGGTAVSGKSSELGDDDDSEMFQALRAVPDVILVGAATVAAENYRPITLDETRRRRRSDLGLAETPTLAIVSGRLSIDPDARVFGDPDHKPLIITSTFANPSKLVLIGDSADVAILPDLEPATILQHLGAAKVVLVEGGPSLNGQFVASGLVDEVNVSTSPLLLSGESARIAHGPVASPPQRMLVDRVLFGDRLLFVRYLRDT